MIDLQQTLRLSKAVATVKNSPLTRRNLQHNPDQYEQLSATTQWGIERTEQNAQTTNKRPDEGLLFMLIKSTKLVTEEGESILLSISSQLTY